MKELRFENPLGEDSDDEEVAFTIMGERTDRHGVRVKSEERFECMARPPAGFFDALAAPRLRVAQVVRLCLKPDEERRFDALLVDKDFDVNPSVLKQVWSGLLEHYGGPPTTAPTASGAGRDKTETSSPEDSSSPGSTSDNSA